LSRHVIRISGIRAWGRHGANTGERDEAQEFRIDLEVEVEVDGDSLTDTVDYRLLTELTKRTVDQTSFELLETLAQALAHVAMSVPRVVSARTRVHKPQAAAALGVDDVTATASRGDG
jgi:dihydroneopterin aldolase